MTEIALTEGGPIEGTFKIDLSKGPGAYEFRGRRGSGKTTLISSIDWLAGHKVDITLHDGALSGKVEGFGVIAPIGGRKRRKGKLELDTIDAEKFSLTDLIDPPGKTPEVRDAHAIKALAVLSETKADRELYYELAGGQEAFDKLGVATTDDPVLLATRIKKAYDKQAGELENTAEAEAEHAIPLEAVPEGLDLSQSSDLEALSTARDEARDRHKTLVDQRESGLAKEKEAVAAKERLRKIKEEYAGSTVSQAQEEASKAAKVVETAAKTVEDLKAKLATAEADLEAAKAEEKLASQRVETASQHEEAISTLETTANQEVSYPSTEEIASAQEEVSKASEAYNQGIRIRDVKQNQVKAESHRQAEQAAKKEAEERRSKAKEVFDVFAKSLHTKHLEILLVDGAPRLFVQHPKRGRTAFDRVNGVSDGERVDFALRELLPHIDSPGLLPIPQQCWQDLQPSDRLDLHNLAAEKGFFIFGGQITEGDLRVVYLGDEELPENPSEGD